MYPPRLNQLWSEEGREAGREEVERHARDGLVALEVDRGEAVDRREQQRRADAGEQSPSQARCR